MNTWARNPLNAQWLIVGVGLVLLALILVAGLYERRERVFDLERARFDKLSDIIELNLAGRTFQTDTAMKALRNLVPADHPEQWSNPDLASNFARLIPFIGNVEEIALIDASGRLQHSTMRAAIGSDLSSEPLFQQFKADPTNSEHFRFDYLRNPDGKVYVVIARSIITSDKRFAGIVMASLSLDFVRRLLDSTRYADDMRVSMASSDGRVLAVTPKIEGVEGKNIAVAGSHFTNHMESGRKISYFIGKTVAVGDMTRFGMLRSVVIPNTPGPQVTILSMSRNPDDVLADWRQDVKLAAGIYLLFAITVVVFYSAFYRRQHMAAAELERTRAIHSAELEKQAFFDALTGVPNRRLMLDRLDRAVEHSRRHGKLLALCYLDLDGFKPVNDRLGHEAGDQVLIAVARRLESVVRSGDTVARIGGDEFVVLLADVTSVEECTQVLERILAAIEAPVPLSGGTGHVSSSIGVAMFPGDADDADSLLRNADEAMYAAKHSGKRCHRFFAEINVADRK